MSDSDELCLCVDLGTGGPKIGLVTLEGVVVAYEVHSVLTHFAEDGAATQDAREWWTLISDATRHLLASGVDARRVKAVAVTGQYASTVPVDARGMPTAACLTWLDTRGGHYTRLAVGGWLQGYSPRKVVPFLRKAGGAPSTAGADPVGHILYLTHDHPDVVAKTRWFMEPVDYLTMRLTGVATATHASRLAMWMTDNRSLTTYDYDSQLLRIAGIDESKLPPLVPFASIVGTLLATVADELGLSRDTIVIAGVPDLHAAAVGSGGVNYYDAHLALSTTSWISCPLPKKKTDVIHSIASVPGLSDDSYVMINSQDTGARALDWLRGVLAGSGEVMSFDQMTRSAAASPPGARGVVFGPWLAGERSPISNKNIRAGFARLDVTTTTADLIRAVMEGVAANSAWLLRYVERFAYRELSPIRLVGGGAQSELWCQIYANTLAREVEQVVQPLVAQLRGAALLASIALGQRRLSDASSQPPGRRFQPDAASRRVYADKVEQLVNLYERDKKWPRRSSAK